MLTVAISFVELIKTNLFFLKTSWRNDICHEYVCLILRELFWSLVVHSLFQTLYQYDNFSQLWQFFYDHSTNYKFGEFIPQLKLQLYFSSILQEKWITKYNWYTVFFQPEKQVNVRLLRQKLKAKSKIFWSSIVFFPTVLPSIYLRLSVNFSNFLLPLHNHWIFHQTIGRQGLKFVQMMSHALFKEEIIAK